MSSPIAFDSGPDRRHVSHPTEDSGHDGPDTPGLLHFPTRRSASHGRGPTTTHAITGRLDLIIPAYNEEHRIGRTLTELAEVISVRDLPVHLIVVDNNSVDGTASAADVAIAGSGVTATVISCSARGKGAAVRSGVAHATGEYVGYCDADLPVPADALPWAMSLLGSGWDVVVGSRRCAGASYERRQPLARRVGGGAFRAASARLRGNVADTQCGFKFFRADVARRVFRDTQIDGFSFDLEILARAMRVDGVRLIEMPVPWHDQDGSSFRGVSDGVQSFLDLRRVRRSVHGWQPAEAAH